MFDIFGRKRREEERRKREQAAIAERQVQAYAGSRRGSSLGLSSGSSYTAPAPNPFLDPLSPLSPLYIGTDHSPSSSHCHSSHSHDSGSSSSYDSGSSSCSTDSGSSSSSGGDF